jgi:miniconductance mechanosensitive channel
MTDRFKNFHLISDYIHKKETEIDRHNKDNNVDISTPVNGRRLTNVGTFRAYVSAYLKNHQNIHQGMTFIVRQLPPGPAGLPIEIYVFTRDIVWANYEAIQSDIFDHILAVLPEFGLRIFQNPTGHDFASSLVTSSKNYKET